MGYYHQQLPPILQSHAQYSNPAPYQYCSATGFTSPPSAPPSFSNGMATRQNVLPLPSGGVPSENSMQQPYADFDNAGQQPTPGMKPRVTVTLWEEEGSLCFQVEARGICVARREGTFLLLLQMQSTQSGLRGFPQGKPVAWTVTLSEVPAGATREIISKAIRQQRDKPRHVEVGTLNYSVGADQAAAIIRSLLTSIGPLEYRETTLETTSRRFKATARFLDEPDALEAVNRLSNTALSFNSKARLSVQSVYSAKFKVSCAIFDAVRSRISSRERLWKKENVLFKAYSSADAMKRLRILKIGGETADNVARAKADLESVLAGIVAKDGDHPLWDASLKVNGQLHQALKALERELQVIVIRDKVKSELRLYADERRCAEAQARLAAVLRASLEQTL